MALAARTRWLILGGLLTATLVAMVWVDDQSPPEAGSTVATKENTKENKVSDKKTKAQSLRLSLEKRQHPSNETAELPQDLFKTKSWYVPPPPPKPGPPPPPMPPPLPFKYLGKLLEEGQLTVFLTNQDRNYAVKTGDTIEGSYRVDRVETQRVLFTYLPLNMQQTLAIGGVN